MHLTASPADWYAARAAGIAAYLVLTIVVSFGLSMSGKLQTSKWPKFALEDVHRFGGLLVGALVGVHVLTIAADSYLPFSLGQLIVPLTSRYRPLWTGLGIFAAELLLALAITNHYRRRLPYRFWRRAHYLNFAVWAAATLHGLGSGTDRRAPWMLLLYSASAALVIVLVLYRSLQPRGFVLITGAVSAVALVGLFPLLPTAKPHRPKPIALRFREPLAGQILVERGVSRSVISMAGTGRGRQNVLVRADLLAGFQRLESTSLQLEYLPSGTICRGHVTHVESFGFSGSCRVPGGGRRSVKASWRLVDQNNLRGTIESSPLAA